MIQLLVNAVILLLTTTIRITRTSVVHRNPTAVVEQAIYSITCIARETCVWDMVDYFTHLRSTSTVFDFGGTIFFVSGFVTKR